MSEKTEWQQLSISFTIKDIGAPLITNLAQGLYAAPAVVREYVQNAVDSYVEFAKVIGEKPSNEVRIDLQGNSLHIFDQGIGMGETEIQNAKKIAVSDKPFTSPELFVGFRGIGIWAGLAACKKLIIKTSRYKDKYAYRLTIDFEQIAKNAQSPISIKDLLDPNVYLEKRAEKPELHYTHIELQDITSQYEKLIDPEYLKNVIVETCPTQFDPSFPHGAEIQHTLEHRGVNFYGIYLQGTEVFRDFPKVVNEASYKELEVDGNLVAFAWACINNDETGKLNVEGLQRRNISLRVKNFAVGTPGIYSENAERWRQLGFENIDSPPNLDWYAGEVYVLENDIIPNTPRTELEDSHRTRQFIGKLREYYDELTTGTRVHSEKVNAEKDLKEARELVEGLQGVDFSALDQNKALNLERKVSKVLKDLQEDEKLATRRITKTDKPLHKRVKEILSRKAMRDERAILIGKLERITKELHTKLGIKDTSPTESKPSTSPKSKSKKNGPKTNETPSDSTDQKQDAKDAEHFLQAIIKVVEDVLGVESEEYHKICSLLEELFHKKGMI